MTYVPLGVRSEYSFLDSLCRIPSLVERARALRLEALAIADLHSTLALPRFDLVARQHGIRPLLGARLRLQPEGRTQAPWGDGEAEVALFATNRGGYRNLLQLVSMAQLERGEGEPGITLADLEATSAGLLALDGGLEGPLCRTLAAGRFEEAMQLAGRLREMFGAEHFFVQMQRHGGRDEAGIEAHLLHLARALNIPLVAANDTRYLDAEEARQYEVLRAYAESRSLSDPARTPVRPRQHLRSDLEMQHLFRDLPEALGNTRLVAERCDFQLDLGAQRVPLFETPTGLEPLEELQRRWSRGACARYGVERYQDLDGSIRDRIAHEMVTIEEKKLASCFLLVQDVVRTAKEEGIPAGPGRGSLTGSLVAFALGITQIDPIKHGLSFERFTARSDPRLPDFELHLGHSGREPMLAILRRKVGSAQVAQLAVVERFTGAGAARAAAQVVGLTQAEREEAQPLLRLVQARSSNAPSRNAAKRSTASWEANPKLRAFLEISLRLEGLAHHLAPSAGGVMLAPEPLTQWVSMERSATGQIVAQATHEDAEALGFMRLDLGGSRHVTQQAQTVELVRARTGVALSLEDLPLDDEPTYRTLARGATLGVPQLETPRMQGLLRALQPARFSDLVTMLSPGRAWTGEERGEASETAPPVPKAAVASALQEILEPTRGWLLFEEQVAQIAQRLAGFDAESAEALRSALARSDWRRIGSSRPRFLSGALESGLELKDGEALFARLVAAAGRLASKAHVTGEALLAYRAAYLSTHHPLEFLAAALDHSVGQLQRTAALLEDAVERQIPLLGVEINRSAARCVLEGERIRLGLLLVHQVGEVFAERILEERAQRGAFRSLEEFCQRLPEIPGRTLQELVAAGAFHSLGVKRDAARTGKAVSQARRVTTNPRQLQLGFAPASGAGSESKSPWGGEMEKRVDPARPLRRAGRRIPTEESLGNAPGSPRLWVVGRIQKGTKKGQGQGKKREAGLKEGCEPRGAERGGRAGQEQGTPCKVD